MRWGDDERRDGVVGGGRLHGWVGEEDVICDGITDGWQPFHMAVTRIGVERGRDVAVGMGEQRLGRGAGIEDEIMIPV